MLVHLSLITILEYVSFFLMQSIEREAVEETIEKNTSMATSSIHSESTSSQLDQIFTFQTKSHPHVSLLCNSHFQHIWST